MRTILRQRGLAWFAVAVAVGVVVVASLVVLGDARWSVCLSAGAAVGVSLALTGAVAVSRLRIGEDLLQVQGPFLQTDIPRGLVADAVGGNGVGFILSDGREVHPVAFGQSLLSAFRRSERTAQVAKDVRQWARRERPSHTLDPGADVAISVWQWWYTAAPLLLLLGLAWALALRALAPSVQPYL